MPSPEIDRLSIRSRPKGSPVMHQRWNKLLFLHWPIDPALLRPLIPEDLAIDTFGGQAWVGVTPFTLSGLRPVLTPPIPGLSAFHELNVRTYVHYDDVPGVWFFSLYASKIMPVLGARVLFALPYRLAEMELSQSGNRMQYFLRYTGGAPAEFEASWDIGEELPLPGPHTLEFFLIERYCLYAAKGRRIYRGRIHHPPWRIRAAALERLRSTVLPAQGIPEPITRPLVHQGGDQQVEIWALEAA